MKSREERRVEERRVEERKRKSQKKEDTGARNVRKDPKHVLFSMISGSGGSKSRLAKARVRSQMRNQKLRCEAHFQVKVYKARHVRTSFGSSDFKKNCPPLCRER